MTTKTLIGTIIRVTHDLPSGEDGYYLEDADETFHRINFATIEQVRDIIPHLNKKLALCVDEHQVDEFYTTCNKPKFFTLVK